ncbi:GntR family transcriptional regulator [Ancylobacter sp. FA202]|uniref:GntR family transcriptional regulator n=1 Tax=Ancylobacter sp. FA202 TaxID=1111106 RepID=UPI0003715526|nr:GntR family transcriptional regulator [Ancylobacter sp. FA202]
MVAMTEAADAAKPLYLRMKEDLLRRIQSGEWRPGELVPSENALAAEYAVSVGTARKAIEELADQRLLVRQRGRGTTVAMHNHREQVQRHYRLETHDHVRLNREATYLDVTAARANATEAKALGINRGASISRVRRLRVANSRPYVIEYLVLREDLLPGIGALINATRPQILYELLERQYHIMIAKVEERVTAVKAEPADAELLGVPVGEPMLQIERIGYDLKGVAVERRIMRARNDTRYVSES